MRCVVVSAVDDYSFDTQKKLISHKNNFSFFEMVKGEHCWFLFVDTNSGLSSSHSPHDETWSNGGKIILNLFIRE